ncbi:ankyrin repeat protein [Desulfobaculum xiamenense]|uniref:Ankyrin repeat protein n=1 Tax=Desulfobaculum xiamenense TaxID=995050 RepID=A0A846QLA4_9BACT|nr:ankyrin repeat domain-containing protein [Desulfobaculum xiamenense]NJB67242.1 ankyrin repeat protein [Desulfobaculum xiamenense]
MHDDNARFGMLMTAILDANPAGVSRAIASGAKVNALNDDGESPLCVAAYEGHAEIVGLLLANGADPDARNAFNEPPLVTASMEGHAEVVRMLLEHGASIDATDEDGYTALYLAVFYGHTAVEKLLREHVHRLKDASPNHPDATPRHKGFGARLLALIPHRGHLATVG